MATFTSELTRIPIWNYLDEYGTLLDLPRIPQEENASYKARIKDVMFHRATSQALGLAYGINRELGLSIIDNGIKIVPETGPDGQPRCPDLSIEVRPDGVVAKSVILRVEREEHIVNNETKRVRLEKEIIGIYPIVESPLGTALGDTKHTVDIERNELIMHDDYADATIYVSYTYNLVASLAQTIDETISDLNAMVKADGETILVATRGSELAGTESSHGLFLQEDIIVGAIHSTPTGDYNGYLYIGYGEGYARALGDWRFIEEELSNDGTYFGSDLERYVEQAREAAHMKWSTVQFDRDRWNENPGLAVMPMLTNPQVSTWVCPDPDHTRKYLSEEAAVLGMRCPYDTLPLRRRGLDAKQMRSGIGYGDDLKPVVENGTSGISYTPTVNEFIAVVGGDFSTPTGVEETALSNGGF